MKRTVVWHCALFVGLLLGTVLTGCSTDTKMPEEDKANFKGGPMPKDFVPGKPAPK